jgi:hypothetical protein
MAIGECDDVTDKPHHPLGHQLAIAEFLPPGLATCALGKGHVGLGVWHKPVCSLLTLFAVNSNLGFIIKHVIGSLKSSLNTDDGRWSNIDWIEGLPVSQRRRGAVTAAYPVSDRKSPSESTPGSVKSLSDSADGSGELSSDAASMSCSEAFPCSCIDSDLAP